MTTYYEKIQEALLKEASKSVDPNIAMKLLDAITSYSESTWCAGWLINIEFELWENKQFYDLAKQCKGWWVWKQGDKHQSFITLEEMEKLASELPRTKD